MASSPDSSGSQRFAPHAGQELAEMFDEVSGRYELINTLLTLGRVGAWRKQMWSAVPAASRVVLDLCTGNGASLSGLRQPGRLLIGADVSLGMLEHAAAGIRAAGWAPRLICADAFRLPLADASVDAVTIAFGMRNLRPREDALAELRRVLKPGGTLVVLEATAPGGGASAPFHRFYLRRLVPWIGRLSADPSAYLYLSRSILEFGSGAEFEQALAQASFAIPGRRSFLLGATRLWVAQREADAGQIASIPPPALQAAREASRTGSSDAAGLDAEWRVWTAVQIILSAALLASLVYGLWTFLNYGRELPLDGWQRSLAWTLLVGGIAAFALRTALLIVRWRAGRTGR